MANIPLDALPHTTPAHTHLDGTMDNAHHAHQQHHHAAPAPAHPLSADTAHDQGAHEHYPDDAPLSPAANGTSHSRGGGYGHSPSYQAQGDSVTTADTQPKRRLSKKTQQRLYWVIPLLIVLLVLAILFEVYKSDFERWVTPLTDWLDQREAWSWVIPVVILLVLSFPPLFGHEIVLLVVGLAYPLGVAIGIACAGAIIGEALCFVVFKYCFTSYAERHIREKVRWAAVARLAQESGFWGVLVIRYSVVPPHLANPIFACTGMSFWIYLATVILSLPKVIVFVALGTPSSEHSKGAKAGKVVAIGVVVVITLFATRWIRKRMAVATKEIEAERAASSSGTVQGDLERGSRPEQDLK